MTWSPPGLVLTGGTAAIPGIVELSELVLRMPVRAGIPRRIHGLADSLNSPAYATSVGLLQWAAVESEPNGNGNGSPTSRCLASTSAASSAPPGSWLKTLIPK